MAINLSSAISAIATIKKIYFIAFSLNPHVLNLKANNGISAFSNTQLSNVIPIKNQWFKITSSIDVIFWNVKISGKLKISKVFAGVGNPIKLDVCRVSTLNLANLYADATVINNPINGRYPTIELFQPRSEVTLAISIVWPVNDSLNNWSITIPGTTPLVTTSARLSNSNPTWLWAFKARAAKPSKKSKNIPVKAKKDAATKSPDTAKMIATHPHNKLREVIKFGICFIIKYVIK